MAGSTNQGEHLKDYLTCSICLKVFTDPRTLPCLHTFCFECISQWCKGRSEEEVTCPECRNVFDIAADGITGLKKNFFIGNLLCMEEVKQKTTDTAENCEICSDEEKHVAVEMFCLQCEQRYCKSCSNAHLRMKICSSHTMVSYTTYSDETRSGVDINKKYRSTFCDEHKDKQIELYCFKDKVAICMMCYVNDHSSHKCKEIKKIANEFRIELEQDMECVTTSQRQIDESLRKLTSRKQSLFSHMQSIETNICEKADEMMHSIEIQKQKLISELHGITAKREAEIGRLIETLEANKALLTSFINYSDELLRKGSSVDISREAACLRQRAQELVNRKSSEDILKHPDAIDVTFKPSSVTFDDTKIVIGHLTTGSVTSSQLSEDFSVAAMSGFKKSTVIPTELFKAAILLRHRLVDQPMTSRDADVQVLKTLTSVCHQWLDAIDASGALKRVKRLFHYNPQLLVTLSEPPTDSDGRPRQVSGVVMLEKFVYVVYYGYNKVRVFDCEDCYNKVKDIQVKGLRLPQDMVGSSVTSQLFISDYVSDVIKRVDLKTGVSDVFVELDYSDARLSLVENRLLVASRDSLLMYDIHSGERIKKIPYTEDWKKYGVRHAIESNRDSFFVSHGQFGNNNTVSEIDSEGREIRVFNNEQQLTCVYLALGSVGRLLVTDWNKDCVVLLDEHLKFKRILIDNKRLDNSWPWRLNYNKSNNRLAVGLVNGQVKIFECNKCYCR